MNFLKTAFRYLTRDKAFSFINVFGLAAGLTAVLCIALYVVRELNYDRFHQHADRIYRVSIAMSGDGVENESYIFTPPIGLAMKADIPEIEEYTRMSVSKTFIATYSDKSLKLTDVCYADTAFFDMFAFSLVRGNSQTALTAPFSVVLTEESAYKLFDDQDPVGQTVRLDMTDYTVTGVVKSPPVNSHIQFNALTSFSSLFRMPNVWLGWDGGQQYITYLRLNKNADVETAKAKMQQIIWDNLGKYYEEAGWKISGNLQPMLDVHLYHDDTSQYLRIGLIVFSALALIILAIACINFVNLTTARSMRRVKEASVRKVLGARRFSLVKQFLGESLLIAAAAFVLSLILFKILQPFYVQIAGDLPNAGLTATAITVVFVLTVITGIIGGSYPAMRLSSLDLSCATKGGKMPKSKRKLQNVLIVIQFASSVFLIVCTIAASLQLTLMRNMDLGFNKEGILVLPFNGGKAADRAAVLKQRLQTLSEVSAMTVTSEVPGAGFTGNGYLLEGMENAVVIRVVDVDENFLDVYGIQLQTGRFFSGGEQDKYFYVVNESFAKTFGWNDETIGKTIERSGKHQVIGVVKDFNYAPLYSKVEPLIITNDPWENRFMSIQYYTAEVPAFVSKVEKIWKEINPDVPFEYHFFDELYDNQYRMEMSFRALFAVFAGIAIILAALGVLSLMAYTTEQRKKEIGIRKVLGASVKEVLALLLKQTAVQVLIANLLAWPLAWWVVQMGLSNFAYRISLGPVIFIVAFVVSSLAALLAVGFQALKAATANPVKAIKTE
ncbi:MAG: ABC transporter permease [Dysgonamonadaceae bacterium]|jgi:putative ABC transport system permease protein|nr:ABC transporter permease [Dysgonamonadaceae bacterium]